MFPVEIRVEIVPNANYTAAEPEQANRLYSETIVTINC